MVDSQGEQRLSETSDSIPATIDELQKLLQDACSAEGAFVFRAEARQWLERINMKSNTERKPTRPNGPVQK